MKEQLIKAINELLKEPTLKNVKLAASNMEALKALVLSEYDWKLGDTN